APSTGIGRKSVEPATRSAQSMLPPQRRGGVVECHIPPTGGGIPITPRKGRRSTSHPYWFRPVPASASSSHHRVALSPPATPSRSFSQLGHPPASVKPYVPTRSSSIVTASVCPAFAPATPIRPPGACPEP